MHASERKQRIKISIRILQITVLSIILIITGRFVQLQILEFDKYNPLSQANSIQQERVNPARGLIFDRNGVLLVDNEPIYTITITPINFKTENIPLVAELLNLTEEEVEQGYMNARSFSWRRPSRLLTEVDFNTFSKIQENIWQLPGIGHLIESKRNYPSGIMAPHIMGYLREVTEQEFRSNRNYRLGDRAGRIGLERIYEENLRGQSGSQYLVVNAFGQSIGPYQDGDLDNHPTKGADLYTTIDFQLQELAERLMENQIGGIVAMDPRNGEILAMVSAPQFDISKLSGRVDHEYWASVNADSTTPLFNRAISTMQPPGSTVKPLMGLMGLELGIISEDDVVVCRGGFTRGRLYRCTAEHGRQNLEDAIKNSCNTYFFSLMNQMMSQFDLNTWNRLASEFGLGKRNDIDLPFETRGILPDSSYYNRVFGERQWGVGDLINLGVGQGAFSSSPLQLALLTSQIANDGYWVRPHLVSRIVYSDGSQSLVEPERRRIPWVQDEHLNVVKSGMRKAVTEGSGRFYANLRDIEVAGKTGTAQNPHGQNHGWFITYAPYDNPEIAIAVLMEQSGYGSVSAAPMAALLMEQHFYGEVRRNWVLERMLNFVPPPVESDED